MLNIKHQLEQVSRRQVSRTPCLTHLSLTVTQAIIITLKIKHKQEKKH